MKKSVLLITLILVTIALVACGNGDDEGKVTPTPTPTPAAPRIDVGDQVASQVIEDTRSTGDQVEGVLAVIDRVNCALRLAACSENDPQANGLESSFGLRDASQSQ